MIKEIRFVRRNPDLSPAEFERYWVETHAPLVSASLPRLRKYVVNVVVSRSVGADDPRIDGVVEMYWDSNADMEAAYASPAWMSDERVSSTHYFSDQSARSAPADPSRLQFREYVVEIPKSA